MIKLKQRRERGLTMIEVAMALVLAAIIVAGLVAYMSNARHKVDLRNQAQQLAPWINAADQYVAKNRNQWVTDHIGAAGSHFSVPMQKLIDANLMPGSVKAPALSQQTLWMEVKVSLIKNGDKDKRQDWRVDGLLYTWQGTPLSDDDLGQLVTLLGSRAGAVTSREPNTIKGTAGAWQDPVSNWFGYVHPGHLAVLLGDGVSGIGSGSGGSGGGGGGAGGSDVWLARFQIPHRADLNQMQTSIDMNGHDLNQVKTIRAAVTDGTIAPLGLLLKATLPGQKGYSSVDVSPLWSQMLTQGYSPAGVPTAFAALTLVRDGSSRLESTMGEDPHANVGQWSNVQLTPTSVELQAHRSPEINTHLTMTPAAVQLDLGQRLYRQSSDNTRFAIRMQSTRGLKNVLSIIDSKIGADPLPPSGDMSNVRSGGATGYGSVKKYNPLVAIGNLGADTDDGVNLLVTGHVMATGAVFTSDRRLKKDLTPLPNALAQIERLNGYHFVWRKNNQPSVGVIAQEVQKVYPELVSTNPITHKLGVEYPALVAPLIEAVKQLHQLFIKLEAEVKSLMTTQNGQQQINQLKAELQALRHKQAAPPKPDPAVAQLKAELKAQQRELQQLKATLKQSLSVKQRAACQP